MAASPLIIILDLPYIGDFVACPNHTHTGGCRGNPPHSQMNRQPQRPCPLGVRGKFGTPRGFWFFLPQKEQSFSMDLVKLNPKKHKINFLIFLLFVKNIPKHFFG
jgi:hypothetical protein